jgi:phosphoribosylaminoimidazole-succinocarboxamide synthase
MNNTINGTDFKFPGQTDFQKGSVRDIYTIDDKYLVMVATDRISAFDVPLPVAIPFKGQVLNQIAVNNLQATADIVPNWLISSPHPNVSIGHKCQPYKIEMVIRGYLTGHAWRVYKSGERTLCGVALPEGMRENDKFPEPIITPATHADEGHDEDISKEEIINQGLIEEGDYKKIEDYTRELFAAGTKAAEARGLILVDTKYEFGKKDGKVILMDEIHTPDSSRYFYADGFSERQARGEAQRQLSKEFVRQWLISRGFNGQEDQQVPDIPTEFVEDVSRRYIELYEQLTGKKFERFVEHADLIESIETNTIKALKEL